MNTPSDCNLQNYPSKPIPNILKKAFAVFGVFGFFAFHPVSLQAGESAPSCGQEPVNICLMLDRTGSVSAEERNGERDAVQGLLDEIDELDNGTEVAIGRFGDNTDGGTEAEVVDADPMQGGFQVFTTNYAQAKVAVGNALSSGSSVDTNLEDAVEVCRKKLIDHRDGDQDVLILVSDGDANEDDTAEENSNENDDNNVDHPFADEDDDAAFDAAEEAKGLAPYLQDPLTTLNPGIRIFTIAFGSEGGTGTPFGFGTRGDVTHRNLLALMASGNSLDDHCDDTGTPACDAAEITAENGDLDSFFISPKTEDDLSNVFDAIFEFLQCEDPNPNDCTTFTCEDNSCVPQPVENCEPCDGVEDCNDSNQCTTDTCEEGRCQHADRDGESCEDGDLCTQDTCDGDQCVPGDPKECDPPAECFKDGVCQPGTGECTFEPQGEGVSCEDPSSCDGDEVCDGAGNCVEGDPVACECENPCEVGQCVENDGAHCECMPVADGTSCDDGNVCNGVSTCQEGECTDGDALDCNDSENCTEDSCNPVDGCVNAPIPECGPPDDETPPPGCPDQDSDTVCDEVDNCVADPNTDQADADQDGIGDVCDGDDSGQVPGTGAIQLRSGGCGSSTEGVQVPRLGTTALPSLLGLILLGALRRKSAKREKRK